jgi:3-oxoadipate enol-lactonase
MPFIRVNSLTVHYQLDGPAAAPVILFGNSLGTNLHLWDAQLPALRERFRLLRYDMRGHGMTDAPAEAYTIDQLAYDALGLLDALKLDKARYCGLSIGGMIGQRLGVKAPGRFLQLALCNTGMSIGTPQLWQDRIAAVRQGGLGPMVDGVMQRWFTPASFKNKPELLAGYRNMLVRTPADGYIGCCRAIAGTDLAAARASPVRRWWWWALTMPPRRPNSVAPSRGPSRAPSWSRSPARAISRRRSSRRRSTRRLPDSSSRSAGWRTISFTNAASKSASKCWVRRMSSAR